MKLILKSRFCKSFFSHKKLGFDSIYQVKRANFAIACKFKKNCFGEIFFPKKHDFEWKSFCRKHDLILNENFSSCQILKYIFYKVSVFSSTYQKTRHFWNWIFHKISDYRWFFWTRVWFWTEFFTARQTLSVLLLQFAKFSGVHQNRACLGNVWMYGVGSVFQVILLG